MFLMTRWSLGMKVDMFIVFRITTSLQLLLQYTMLPVLCIGTFIVKSTYSNVKCIYCFAGREVMIQCALGVVS